MDDRIITDAYVKTLSSEIVSTTPTEADEFEILEFVNEADNREHMEIEVFDNLVLWLNGFIKEVAQNHNFRKYRLNGDIYYHNIYGDVWKLRDDGTLTRFGWGF